MFFFNYSTVMNKPNDTQLLPCKFHLSMVQ